MDRLNIGTASHAHPEPRRWEEHCGHSTPSQLLILQEGMAMGLAQLEPAKWDTDSWASPIAQQ